MSYSILDLAKSLAQAGFRGTLFKDHYHPAGSIFSPEVPEDEVNAVLRRDANLVLVTVKRTLAAQLGACVPIAVDWRGKPKVLSTFKSQSALPILTERQQDMLKEAGDAYCVGPVTPAGKAWLEIFSEEGSAKATFQGKLVTSLHLLPQLLVEAVLEAAGFTEPEVTAVSICGQDSFSNLVAIGSHQGSVHNGVTPTLVRQVLERSPSAEHPRLSAQLEALLSPEPWFLGDGFYTSAS